MNPQKERNTIQKESAALTLQDPRQSGSPIKGPGCRMDPDDLESFQKWEEDLDYFRKWEEERLSFFAI